MTSEFANVVGPCSYSHCYSQLSLVLANIDIWRQCRDLCKDLARTKDEGRAGRWTALGQAGQAVGQDRIRAMTSAGQDSSKDACLDVRKPALGADGRIERSWEPSWTPLRTSRAAFGALGRSSNYECHAI